MTQDVAELKRLSQLLDESIDLDPVAREAWLDALPQSDQPIVGALRKMLAARTDTQGSDAIVDINAIERLSAAGGAGSLAPGDTVGPYRLQRLLAQGGMGDVWLAERSDGVLRRTVALKLPVLGLHRSVLVQRFARERDILGALAHPNIARLYDAGLADDGQPYLALEFVKGERIDEHCDRHGLDARARVRLFLQVLSAVQYAHAQLVVHLDIKPSNVLVAEDGRAILLDFGIAKLLDPGESATSETEITRLGGRALTPDYAAPEQLRGEAVSIATDVWALGVLLHRLSTGEQPFHGADRPALEHAVLHQEPPRPSHVKTGVAARLPRMQAADLDLIVGKALHKVPAERYATVDALAEDLTRWLASRPVRARPARAGYRLRQFVVRNRLAVGASAGAVGAVLVALGVALWQAHEAGQQADAARAQAERARQEAARAHAVQGFLLDIFRTNSRRQADPRAAELTTARELLDRGAARVDDALASAPEARIEVLRTLADMYLEIGQRNRAQELEQRRVEVARQALRPDDTRRADALLALARFLYDGPGREQARALLAEAQGVLDAAGDRDSPVRGAFLTQAARFHRYESLRESIASAEAALEFQRRRGGDGQALVRALLMAGAAHLGRLDYARAEPLLAEARTLASRRASDRASALIVPAAELADVWLTIGRIAEAEQLLREVIAESARINGPTHGITLVLRMQLTYLLLHTGRTAEGLALQEEIRLTIAADGDAFLPAWRENAEYLLLRNAIEMGRPDLVAPKLAQSIEELQAEIPGSGVIAHRTRMLADALTAAGRLDEAEQRLARAEAIWARFAAGVDEAWGRLNQSHLRGRLLLAQGRVDAAIDVLQAMPPARLPPGAAIDLHAIRRDIALSEAWQAKGDAARAGALARAALDRLKAVPAPYRLAHLEALAWRALGLAQRGAADLAAARTSLEQSIRLRRAHDLPASVWLARAERDLQDLAPGSSAVKPAAP